MFNYNLQKEIFNLMQKDVQYNDLMAQIMDGLVSNNLTMNNLETLIDTLINSKMEGWMDTASDNMCINNNGIILTDSNGKKSCMYNKTACNQVIDPNKDTAPKRKWSDKTNRCLAIVPAIKDMCDQNNMPYDIDKGTCVITSDMCISKTGVPKPSDAKGNDPVTECEVPIGIEICSAIFGEVLCKSLDQVFNLNQYYPCNDGDNSVPATIFCQEGCRDPYTNNKAGLCVAPTLNEGPPNHCVNGDKNVGDLCYSQCRTPSDKSGNYNFQGIDSNMVINSSICVKDCASYNMSNNGSGTCLGKCPDGWNLVGGVCYNSAKSFLHMDYYVPEIDKSPCSDLLDVIVGAASPPTCTGGIKPTRGVSYIAPSATYSGWSCDSGHLDGSDPIKWIHAVCRNGEPADTCLIGTDPCDSKEDHSNWCCNCGGDCRDNLDGQCYAWTDVWPRVCNRGKGRGCIDKCGAICKSKDSVKCTRSKTNPSCDANYKLVEGICWWDKGLVDTRKTKYICKGNDTLVGAYCYRAAGNNNDAKAVYDGTICGANHNMNTAYGTCSPNGGISIQQPSIVPDQFANRTSTMPVCKPGTSQRGALCYRSGCPSGTKLAGDGNTCSFSGTLNDAALVPKTYARTRKVPINQ
jgi:hypothetical protein